MTKPKLTPQIPGQPAQAETTTQAAEALNAGDAGTLPEAIPPAADGDTETQGDTPEITAPDESTPAPEVIETPQIPGQPVGLPDASDIDPTKIKRAVQTKQGIICPA